MKTTATFVFLAAFLTLTTVSAEAAIINVGVTQDLRVDANINQPGEDMISFIGLPPVDRSLSISEAGGNSASTSQTINVFSLGADTLQLDIVSASTFLLVGGDPVLPTDDGSGEFRNIFVLQFEITSPIAYSYSAAISSSTTGSLNASVSSWSSSGVSFFVSSILDNENLSSSGILEAGMYDITAIVDVFSSETGIHQVDYSVSLILGAAAVPEPSTLLLGAIACVGMLMRRRRAS
ncbi:MAG: PEP-CTERM sorting domain-containing protein [Planctomycetes bacterium]|nr:PEP-CTERM sorting domain-containing protein [Planctomycetota bacterium]